LTTETQARYAIPLTRELAVLIDFLELCGLDSLKANTRKPFPKLMFHKVCIQLLGLAIAIERQSSALTAARAIAARRLYQTTIKVKLFRTVHFTSIKAPVIKESLKVACSKTSSYKSLDELKRTWLLVRESWMQLSRKFMNLLSNGREVSLRDETFSIQAKRGSSYFSVL
jgi:hypothetical protein